MFRRRHWWLDGPWTGWSRRLLCRKGSGSAGGIGASPVGGKCEGYVYPLWGKLEGTCRSSVGWEVVGVGVTRPGWEVVGVGVAPHLPGWEVVGVGVAHLPGWEVVGVGVAPHRDGKR